MKEDMPDPVSSNKFCDIANVIVTVRDISETEYFNSSRKYLIRLTSDAYMKMKGGYVYDSTHF